MDLRQLRYFVAVAEEGHVTRAAERLGIQQPPLSQAIQAFERELDVQLFRRKPRGVELTEAGAALKADATRILADVEAALARARRTARGEEGRITIGFTISAPFHPFVPGVLRAFRENHPQVMVHLEESGTAELVAALRAERIDAAFVRSPADEGEGVSIHPLLDEPMVAALPRTHPLARGKRSAALALTDLAATPFVLYRRASGPGLYDAITAACRDAGFTPRVGQEAPHLVATLNLVASGLGITLVPASLSAMRLDGVVFRPLAPVRGLVAPLRLACRTVDHAAVARRFVALARQMARTSAAG